MSKKGKVKMGLGDFLGSQAAAASQPVKGRILPSGPDPNRDPDERRGGGGRRYDDDYDGPGSRAEGADTWRRGPGGGGVGMGTSERRGGGYDNERGGMAPEDGTWRSRAPPARAGGGGYSDRYGDRDGGREGGRMGGGGFDDRRGGRDGGGYDAPPPTERKRLQLHSRTAPLPLPPMSPKESEKPTPAPASRPSGPRSNPFGAAQAVDTTQRDREIEAKLESERQTSFRRRDDTFRSSDKSAVATGDSNPEEAGTSVNGVDEEIEQKADLDDEGGDEAKPEVDDKEADVESTAPGIEDAERGGEKPAPPKPVGRWAALRREGGGDDRPSQSVGGFTRRDRDDDRRGGGYGRDDRPSFGRKSDDVGPGRGSFTSSRMGREPVQPPAPPAGNAFAKRFGSNFDRDTDRAYPRSSGGMGGGGFDRRDDERRAGMGGVGFDRRDDERRVGMGGGGFDRRGDFRGGGGGGMGMGPSRFNRDRESDSQRRPDPSSPLERPTQGGRLSGGSTESPSPARSFSQMSIKETKEAKPLPNPVPKPEVTPMPKPEPQPESKPEPEPEPKEDPTEVARASAEEALASGKRGTELKEFVMTQEKRTTAGALLAAAMKDIATPQDMNWARQEEFGAALVALSADNTEEQVGIIYAVVGKCHEMGFPKETSGAVVQTIFMGMYNCDLCEEEAFIEWKDDVDSTAEGRLKAVMQSTPWFVWLESVDEEED